MAYGSENPDWRFMDRVAAGEVPGYRRVALYGNNPDVDGSTLPEDAWSGGGVYPWMTGATSLEIASTDAADTAAGAGARTVLIQGLDTNYAEISSVVSLNGITAAAIPAQFFRINGAIVLTAGTGQTNAGTISIRNSGGGTTRAVIPIGVGLLKQSAYTVPAGYQLYITSVSGAINRDTGAAGTKVATITSWVRGTDGVVRQPGESPVGITPFRDTYTVPAVLDEKTDTVLRIVSVSADNLDITAGIMGYIKLKSAS